MCACVPVCVRGGDISFSAAQMNKFCAGEARFNCNKALIIVADTCLGGNKTAATQTDAAVLVFLQSRCTRGKTHGRALNAKTPGCAWMQVSEEQHTHCHKPCKKTKSDTNRLIKKKSPALEPSTGQCHRLQKQNLHSGSPSMIRNEHCNVVLNANYLNEPKKQVNVCLV